METIVLKIEDGSNSENLVETIIARLKGNDEVKLIIEHTKSVKDRIKTLEDALQETGKTMPDFSGLPDEMRKRYNALFAIEVIAEVLNEGWTPNWDDETQKKWVPWFRSVSSGFVFDHTDYGYSFANAGRGSRLCFKSEELAAYAGKKFVKLYEQFMM